MEWSLTNTNSFSSIWPKRIHILILPKKQNKFPYKILRRTLRPWVKWPPHNSVNFAYLISLCSTGLLSFTIKHNNCFLFITSMHCHRRSELFYLHSSPKSAQFPQSPGPGPDILMTGSCRSLCRKKENNHEIAVMKKY